MRAINNITMPKNNSSSPSASSLQGRAQRRIAYLRGQASTFTTPLYKTNKLEIKTFLQSFYETIWTREKRLEYKRELDNDPVLAKIFESLVLRRKLVAYEDFFQRFEYRCDLSRVIYDLLKEDNSRFMDGLGESASSATSREIERTYTAQNEDKVTLSPSTVIFDSSEMDGRNSSSNSSSMDERENSTPTIRHICREQMPPEKDDTKRNTSSPSNSLRLVTMMPIEEPSHLGHEKVRSSPSMQVEKTQEEIEDQAFLFGEAIVEDPSADSVEPEIDNLSDQEMQDVDACARQMDKAAQKNEELEIEDIEEIKRLVEQAQQLEQVRLAEQMAHLEATYDRKGTPEPQLSPIPIQSVEAVEQDDRNIGDLTTSMGEDSFDAILQSAEQTLQNVQSHDENDSSSIHENDSSSAIDLDSSQHRVLEELKINDFENAKKKEEFFDYDSTDEKIYPQIFLKDEERSNVAADEMKIPPDTPTREKGSKSVPKRYWNFGSFTKYKILALAIYFSMLFVSAIFCTRLNSRVSDFVCAPMRPGTFVSELPSGESMMFRAPWWAPDTFKESTFNLLCPSHSHVEILIEGTKRRFMRVDTVPVRALAKKASLSWKNIRSFGISPDGRTVQVNPARGKSKFHPAPWATAEEENFVA